MITQEEKEILAGNILISQFLFGVFEDKAFYQIGYNGSKPSYREIADMFDENFDNFNNNWGLLMNAIAKIAKDRIEQFSQEEILIDNMKSTMFEFAYDPMLTWYVVVRYIKLKNEKNEKR